MPRLPVHRLGPSYQFLDPDDLDNAATREVWGLRLYATISVGPDPTPPAPDQRPPLPAILDTGAAVSIFPYVVWRRFAHQIEWLFRDPAVPPPTTVHLPTQFPANFPAIANLDRIARRNSTIIDGPFPALMGRVWIAVSDERNEELPAARVVGLFRCDFGSRLKEPVLGMNAGVLDGRRLVRDTVLNREMLPYPGDVGPHHG